MTSCCCRALRTLLLLTLFCSIGVLSILGKDSNLMWTWGLALFHVQARRLRPTSVQNSMAYSLCAQQNLNPCGKACSACLLIKQRTTSHTNTYCYSLKKHHLHLTLQGAAGSPLRDWSGSSGLAGQHCYSPCTLWHQESSWWRQIWRP